MKRNFLFLFLIGGLIGMILMGRKLVRPAIETMARAIMDFEGWFEGSRSQRNNNPGNLKFRGQYGAVRADIEGHAVFKTFEDGWNALIEQLRIAFEGGSQIYKPTMSLNAFFSFYSTGNSVQYARFVAERLGVDPNTRLQDLA